MECNSGVYVIKNNMNQKCYVGSTKNIRQRLSTHKSMLMNGTHHNVRLQEDYNKYGIEAFTFDVLIECPEDEARKQEAHFIHIFNCERDGYNSRPDKENIERRDRFNETKVTELLKSSLATKTNRQVTYVFDFWYVCDQLKLKPSNLIHLCGIDNTKRWPSYKKVGQYVVGCDSIDGDLNFLVCFCDTEWNGEFVYV